MNLAAALIYWMIVALWFAVLATVIFHFIRNPRIFGATRLLLLVVAIDTCRNIVENVYFGLFFGSQYGLFSSSFAEILGSPSLLILPKIGNIVAGCVVFGLLLIWWLPEAVRERGRSDLVAADLEKLATLDGLTSLTNRRHFDALARAEWVRFQRYGRPLSVLIVDVDHFKSINDRFGHDVGDAVLKSIADCCSADKRETDVVARIGGEEFAFLLPETSEDAAVIVAERLRKRIESHSPTFHGEMLQLSVSIGVAGATLSMSTFEVVLKRADEALYEAKRTGRNKIVKARRMADEACQVAAE